MLESIDENQQYPQKKPESFVTHVFYFNYTLHVPQPNGKVI